MGKKNFHPNGFKVSALGRRVKRGKRAETTMVLDLGPPVEANKPAPTPKQKPLKDATREKKGLKLGGLGS